MSDNADKPDADEIKVTHFDGCYDLSYDYETQTVLFYDIQYQIYHSMNYHLFWAFIKAHYHEDEELQLRIRDAVLNFKSVRIIPSKMVAGIRPLYQPNFEQLALKIMNETVGVEFRTEAEKREFYLENYGINLLS